MSLTNPGRKNDRIANRATADVDAILLSRDCVLISMTQGYKNHGGNDQSQLTSATRSARSRQPRQPPRKSPAFFID
jgi:hypothetical protein